jgi:hypothetical protein
MTEEIPDYLGKERVHEREKWWRDTDVGTRREETGMYWMEGKERRCRMCYEERETIEHMWNGCGGNGETY